MSCHRLFGLFGRFGLLFGAFALAGAAGVGEGFAAEGAAPEAFASVCKADIGKLCAGAPQGNGPVAQCLADNRAQVGKRCLTALRRARRVSMFRAACGGDVTRLCADARPGKGRILACLSARTADLSADCGALVGKRGARRGAATSGADADAAAVADQAAVEQQQNIEPVPPSIPVAEDQPASGPAADAPAK